MQVVWNQAVVITLTHNAVIYNEGQKRESKSFLSDLHVEI